MMRLTPFVLLLASLLTSGAATPAAAQDGGGQVRHMVVFKFKEGATPDQIRQVTDALRALKDTIPGIVSFERGVNNSPEKKNLGFTHAFLITFENAKARDAYLPHPEHRKFGQLLGQLGVMEDVFVVDYQIEK